MTEPTEDTGCAPATDLNADKREQVAKQLKALSLGRISAARTLADLLVPVDNGTPPATLGAELQALSTSEQPTGDAQSTKTPRGKRA